MLALAVTLVSATNAFSGCGSLPHSWKYVNLHTSFVNREGLALEGGFENGARTALLVVFNPGCPTDGEELEGVHEAVSDLQKMNIDVVMHMRDVIAETPGRTSDDAPKYVPLIGLALGPVRKDGGQAVIGCGERTAEVVFPVIAADESGAPSVFANWFANELGQDPSLGSLEALRSLDDGLKFYWIGRGGAVREYRRGEGPPEL